MLGRKFALKDVHFVRNGAQQVTVFKLTHPQRHQQLMLVPTPRYGSEKFYDDWVYQPYAQDNHVLIGNDIYSPMNVAVPRTMKRHFKKFPDLTYFRLVDMPDCVECNISRREFLAKEKWFKGPVAWTFTMTPELRDRYVNWVARRITKLVGDRYLTHPHTSDQSFVLLLPPAQVVCALNTLHALGFEVADRTTTEVGDDVELKKMTMMGWWSNMACLVYLYGLFFIFFYSETIRTKGAYKEYAEKLEASAKERREIERKAREEFE